MRVGYRMRMLIVQELNLRSWRYILQDQGNMIRFNFLNTHIACKRLSSNDNGFRFRKSQNTKERLRAFEISHDDRKMIKMLQHGASPCSRRDGGCKVARRLPSHRYPMMGIRHRDRAAGGAWTVGAAAARSSARLPFRGG